MNEMTAQPMYYDGMGGAWFWIVIILLFGGRGFGFGVGEGVQDNFISNEFIKRDLFNMQTSNQACCCETQKEILESRYTNQLGLQNLGQQMSNCCCETNRNIDSVRADAYKNACVKAGPVLMEPIMKLEVVTPEENMGDVIGDLNKRRGQVEGMDETRSGARIIRAMVPLAEMFGYVTALRTITSGRATSSMEYDHHAPVSSSIAKTVLEEIKGRVDLV